MIPWHYFREAKGSLVPWACPGDLLYKWLILSTSVKLTAKRSKSCTVEISFRHGSEGIEASPCGGGVSSGRDG